MQKDLFQLIEERFPKMSKSHKLIASYILKSGEVAAYLTATKLGAAIGVSESTVVRFAIELGFSGYPEFQRVLQQSLRSKLTSVQRMEVAATRYEGSDFIDKTFSSDAELIKSTRESISREAFEGSVEAINKAKKIYILGVRSSAAIASFAPEFTAKSYTRMATSALSKRAKP